MSELVLPNLMLKLSLAHGIRKLRFKLCRLSPMFSLMILFLCNIFLSFDSSSSLNTDHVINIKTFKHFLGYFSKHLKHFLLKKNVFLYHLFLFLEFYAEIINFYADFSVFISLINMFK